MLGFIDGPERGEFAGEGKAEGFEDAGEAFVDGGGFGDDLADDELDAEAAFAAVLLGDVAEDAADGNRAGLFTAAAEAGFDFDVLSGGILQTHGMLFDVDSMQRFMEEGSGFGLHFGRKGRFEANEGLELG